MDLPWIGVGLEYPSDSMVCKIGAESPSSEKLVIIISHFRHTAYERSTADNPVRHPLGQPVGESLDAEKRSQCLERKAPDPISGLHHEALATTM